MIGNCFGALNCCEGRGDPAEQPHEQGTENEHGFKFLLSSCAFL